MAFLKILVVATIILTADSVVTACNSSSEKLLGQPRGGLIGCRLADLDLHFVDADGIPEKGKTFPYK